MFVCILRHFKRYPERGNVLLSTILIMGITLNIGLVIATLALSGFSRARNIKLQSLSYYGAESGVEYSLFKVRKGGSEIGNLNINAATESGVSWESAGKIFSLEIFEDLEEDKSIILYLYNPDTWTSGINRLLIKWNDTCYGSSVLEIKYYEINEQTDLNNLNWTGKITREWIQEETTPPGTIEDLFLNSNNAYAMKITVKNCYVNVLNINPQVYNYTTGQYEETNINIENVITSTGASGDVKQTIRVSM
ncbi:MAG: hypothetical protein V1892_03150 [bacterium]